MASSHARRPLHRWTGPAHRASGLERAAVRNYLRIALALLLTLLVLPSSGGSATAEDVGTTGSDSSLTTEVVDESTIEPADDPTGSTDTTDDSTPVPADDSGAGEIVEGTTGDSSDDGTLGEGLTTGDAGSRMGIMTTSWTGKAYVKVLVGGIRTGGTTVSDLAGVELELAHATAGRPLVNEDWSTCTSGVDGFCTFEVQLGYGAGKVAPGTQLWVVQPDSAGMPDGWYSNQSLVTARNPLVDQDYVFKTPALAADETYVSTNNAHFMKTEPSSTRVYDASNGRWQNSMDNPSLRQSCEQGIDVALVLDLSNSIEGSLDTLKDSAYGFIEQLADTGSSVALYTFASKAPRSTGDSGRNYDLAPVTTDSLPTFKDRIDDYALGGGDGATNWDQGLWQVAASGDDYDVAVVLTDGNPTVYGPGEPEGPGDYTRFVEMEQAVFSANAIKDEGTRLLAVGVGAGVSGSGANLSAVSGPLAYNGDNAKTADYFQADWNKLAEVLSEIATGIICEASITVIKHEIGLGETAGTPADGWTFDSEVTAGAAAPTTATATTDSEGRASFGLTFADPGDTATVQITETQQANWQLDGVQCSDKDGTIPATVTGSAFTLQDLASGDHVTCTVTNREQARPSIAVTKTATPGSVPETGGEVTYDVTVENTGPVDVTLTDLDDDKFGDLLEADNDQVSENSCLAAPKDIAVDATYACSFTATVAGDVGKDHVNVVTAKAEDGNGREASDVDDATVTFTDVLPTVEVTKSADKSSVPETGAEVEYTVTVKNTSKESVKLTKLVDDKFGDLFKADNDEISDSTCTAQAEIKPGKSYTCKFTALIDGLEPGEKHVNVVTGTVTDNEDNEATDEDDETVTITDVAPTVKVTKTADRASVPEPGGEVTYTVTVKNTSTEKVTLTDLADNKFGNLLDDDNDAIESTTCEAGQSLAVDEVYTCTFTGTLTGLDAGDTHDNIVTATVVDDDDTTATGEDDESVGVTDVLPTIVVTKSAPSTIREPGGPVTYAVTVENTSVEPVILRTLVDDKFGDLLDDAGNDKISASTCVDDSTIAVGATYTCTFVGTVAGDAGYTHTNVVTATAEDDEENTATDDDDATVTVSDVAPVIDVTKDADRASVPETGGSVTYTVGVKNLSSESVRLVSLVDDRFGDLLDDAGNGAIRNSTCVDDTAIAVGATYTCTFVATVGGGAGSAHVNVVTAVAVDNDGSRASDFDTATVRVTDVPPTIELTKDAAVDSVAETGELVTFTASIRNTGVETVTITKLVDDVYGDLLDPDNDLVGSSTCARATIVPGTTYTCTFVAMVTGDPGEDHRNVITGTVRDDDGSTVTDEDDETIIITDVAPTIEVTKTADVESVDASGGQVTYTVTVENTSAEAVTLTDLDDDKFGDLLDADNALVDSTCEDGKAIAAGATYTCTFTATVEGSGGFHVNVVTGTVVDDDGTEAVAEDDESVVINEVLGEEEERPEAETPRPAAPRPGADLGILPDTGAGRMAGQLGMVGALMLLIGGGILLSRRRREG